MSPRQLDRIFAAIAALYVVIAIVWGFVLVGSPGSQRLRKLDDRRIQDLQRIRDAIERWCVEWEDGKAKLRRPLPSTLEELAESIRRDEFYALELNDPQTGEQYGYAVLEETAYELCATFALPRSQQTDTLWNHPAGRHCLTFDVISPRDRMPRLR